MQKKLSNIKNIYKKILNLIIFLVKKFGQTHSPKIRLTESTFIKSWPNPT